MKKRFCAPRDSAVSWLLKNTKIQKILIVDLDVHQGNGTASLMAKEDRVFTFSMHGENNYPIQKETSDLDVPLKDGISDIEYLYLLDSNLDSILSKFNPDFMFYQCGVDILSTDKLGKLGVSIQGCATRDKIVFETANQLNIPIVCSMGGGYSPQIRDIVEAHANTFRIGLNLIM
jgi:acetoin utilization deacetylase AcuC-like enzyme